MTEAEQDVVERELANRAGGTASPNAGEWQGAREYATAAVNRSNLTEDAKREALAILARLPCEVVEDVADELVELWCSGWVEGAARLANSGLMDRGTEAPGVETGPWLRGYRRGQEDATTLNRQDPYNELAELAAAFTRRVAESGLVDDNANLALVAEQVQHLAEKVDQATTAAEIIRRTDRPTDPETGLQEALTRFYEASYRRDATNYAEGMVDGAKIANGVDPDTGEVVETLPVR